MLKKISFLILGVAIVSIVASILCEKRSSTGPMLIFMLPNQFKGVIVLHSNNSVVNDVSDSKVNIQVSDEGHAYVNKSFISDWYALRFYEMNKPILYWHESKYPIDNEKRIFNIFQQTKIQFPKDASNVFFVGTGRQCKDFVEKNR